MRRDRAPSPRTPAPRHLLLAGAATLVLLGVISPRSAQAWSSWPRDTFTTIGFVMGDPADTSRYRKINNAGIDIVVHDDKLTISELMATKLDQLRALYPTAFSLQMLASYSSPANPGVFSFNVNAPPPCSSMDTTLCRVDLRRPSVKGYFVWDEPCTTFCTSDCGDNGNCFVNVDATMEIINNAACSAGRLPYVNLLPYHGTACFAGACGSDEFSRYNCYLESYLNLYNDQAHAPPMLSVDHYPFQADGNVGPQYTKYFLTLKAMREKAAKYSRAGERVPLWLIVQLSQWTPLGGSTNTQPTMNQVRWQAYNGLAYGAKSIGYFTLAPYTVGDGAFGAGILSATDTTTKYSPVRVLNQELHKLGPTLMKLQSIATYHMDSLGFHGLAEELMSYPHRVYNIVSTMTGSSGANQGMFGYLKDVISGADHLLVVNKDAGASRTFTLTLTNKPTGVKIISKATGLPVTYSFSGSSFTVTLAPGDGQLFRIDDAVDEYIPNVNAVAVNGSRTYYAHEKGLVMVDGATGYRTHVHDGTVFTPIVDIAIGLGDSVYACQTNTVAGNVVSYVPDLSARGSVWAQAFQRPMAVATSGSKVLIASRRTSGGVVVVLDRATGTVDSCGTGSRYNDVEIQPGTGAFVAAHDGGINRFRLATGLPLLKAWTTYSPIVDVEATATAVFGAKDDGTTGLVAKLDSILTNAALATWSDGSKKPRMIDIKLSTNATQSQILAASIKGTTQKFTRLQTSNLSVVTSYAFTGPRTSYVFPDLTALAATNTAVNRLTASGSLVSRSTDVESLGGPELEPSLTAFPNPGRNETTIRFVLPRAQRVQLAVFDIAGRKVASLVDGHRVAGSHDIAWRPGASTAGVFFTRLTFGSRSITRSVILVR